MADTPKPIPSKISLTIAMGVTRGTTPQQFIEKWDAWSKKYPKEKSKLNPAMTGLLDALTIIITVENTLQQIMQILETVVSTLNDTYNAAMACVPGVGAANASKIVAEKSKFFVKQAMDKAIASLQTLPQTVYDVLASQVTVDEGAML